MSDILMVPTPEESVRLADPPMHRSSGGLRSKLARTPPSRVIVQCADEIDEMQRWLEGRE